MKPIYQRIIDPNIGDCFKCNICSLFELEYDQVPNFVESSYWWVEAYNFLLKLGYELDSEIKWNPNVRYLESPKDYCFPIDIEVSNDLFITSLSKKDSLNGLFLAEVYSPKFTNPNEHPCSHLHSVVCDTNFNIVHDPNPEYKGIKNYPYSQLIGYSGIRSISLINKI